MTRINSFRYNCDRFVFVYRQKRAETNACYPEVGCFDTSGPYGYIGMVPNRPDEVNCSTDTILLYRNVTRFLETFRNVSYNITAVTCLSGEHEIFVVQLAEEPTGHATVGRGVHKHDVHLALGRQSFQRVRTHQSHSPRIR